MPNPQFKGLDLTDFLTYVGRGISEIQRIEIKESKDQFFGPGEFGVIPVRGDGNCAPRAIIQALLLQGILQPDSESKSGSKREWVINFITKLVADTKEDVKTSYGLDKPAAFDGFIERYLSLTSEQRVDFFNSHLVTKYDNSAGSTESENSLDRSIIGFLAVCLRKAAALVYPFDIDEEPIDDREIKGEKVSVKGALSTLGRSVSISDFLPYLIEKKIELLVYAFKMVKGHGKFEKLSGVDYPSSSQPELKISALRCREAHYDVPFPENELKNYLEQYVEQQEDLVQDNVADSSGVVLDDVLTAKGALRSIMEEELATSDSSAGDEDRISLGDSQNGGDPDQASVPKVPKEKDLGISVENDEAFARKLQREEDDEAFARKLQREEDDEAFARKLQREEDDEAFARKLQREEYENEAKEIQIQEIRKSLKDKSDPEFLIKELFQRLKIQSEEFIKSHAGRPGLLINKLESKVRDGGGYTPSFFSEIPREKSVPADNHDISSKEEASREVLTQG